MKQSSIKKNALMNILYTVTNMVFPLITYPYVTRILLSTGMGKVSFFTSLSNYAVMLGSLGISTYGIRAIAKVRDDEKNLSKVATELLILNTVVTAFVIIAIIISVPYIDKFNSEITLLIINILIIASTPFGLSWLYSGLEQYSYITKRNIIFKGVSLVLVFLLVRKASDYPIYAALTAFSTIGSYVCNLVYSRHFVKFKINLHLEFKYHIRPMLYLFASILAVNVYTNLDTIMLGFVNGDDAVGFYSVASKVKWILLSAVNAVSAVLLPRLSNYLSKSEIDKYNQALKKSISFVFIITIPLAVFFVIEAPDCIQLLGGPGYEPAIMCMQILMPVLVISGFSNVTGNQVLIPSGRDSSFMRAVIVGAVVDIVLNALLMPSLAAYGAAIATLVAEFSQMAIQLFYARKEVLGNTNTHSLVNALLAASMSGVVIYIFRRNIDINVVVNMIISVIMFSIVYLSILTMRKDSYLHEIRIEIETKLMPAKHEN